MTSYILAAVRRMNQQAGQRQENAASARQAVSK
jgi:hypothetical protein